MTASDLCDTVRYYGHSSDTYIQWNTPPRGLDETAWHVAVRRRDNTYYRVLRTDRQQDANEQRHPSLSQQQQQQPTQAVDKIGICPGCRLQNLSARTAARHLASEDGREAQVCGARCAQSSVQPTHHQLHRARHCPVHGTAPAAWEQTNTTPHRGKHANNATAHVV